MEQQASPIDDTNAESASSDRWTCMRCIWGRPSDQVPSESTTEDLTQSSTDPTDTSSSLKEDLEMAPLNPEQQSQASEVSAGDAKSGKWTCIKKCFSCQNADAQEPIETTDELTQSSTDPTDFSSSSLKEGIEMGSLDHVQQVPSASQQMPTDSVDPGDSKEDSMRNEETAKPHLEQKGVNSSKHDTGTNAETPDLSLETEV